jgi:hypothetical protein
MLNDKGGNNNKEMNCWQAKYLTFWQVMITIINQIPPG